MLNVIARAHVNRVTEPLGRWLVRLGVTPDAVTVAGTVGSVAAALWFLPRGQLFFGTLGVTVFVLFDLVDGAMARAKGKGTPFGAVLDSTCDRIADGALFAALTWWALGVGQARVLGVAALICLVAGQLISYIKARAEGAGLRVVGGLVERAERLILALVGTGLAGLGVPYALDVALWVLAAASLWTVGQRLAEARRSARDLPPEPAGAVNALTDLQYAAGWRLVRLLPARVARAAVPARRRPGRAPQRARACGSCGPTWPGSVPRTRTRDGMRSYARYWCETFRLRAADGPRMVAAHDRHQPGAVPRGPRHRPRPDHRPVAQRQLGRGGRMADRDLAPPRAGPGVHHGRAAPAARVGVPAVRRAPGGAGLRHGRGGGLPRPAATAARRRGRVRARRPRRRWARASTSCCWGSPRGCRPGPRGWPR